MGMYLGMGAGVVCAFFCALGTLVRVGGERIWAGALALAALPVALSPLLSFGLLNKPWHGRTAGFPQSFGPLMPALVLLALIIFLDYLLAARVVRPMLKAGAETALDRAGWRGFAGVAAALGLLCLLPLPLARLVMSLLH